MSVQEIESEPGTVCRLKAKGRILNYDQNSRTSKVLSFRPQLGVRQVSVLSQLNVGESAILVALDLPDSVQNHLIHMGFVPDALVTALRRAPAGDPTVYAVDGMEVALRHETAEAIRVKSPAGSDSGAPRNEELSELAEASR